MTRVEAILKEAEGLSDLEQSELIRQLISRATWEDVDSEELAIGQRGLKSWTESTRGDDWSSFYPEDLWNGGGHVS